MRGIFRRLVNSLKSLLNLITIGYGWWDIALYPVLACFPVWYMGFLTGTPMYYLYRGLESLFFIRAAYSSLIYFPWKTKYSFVPYAIFEVIVFRISIYLFSDVLPLMLFGEGTFANQRVGAFILHILLPRSQAATLLLIYAVVVTGWHYFNGKHRRSSGEFAEEPNDKRPVSSQAVLARDDNDEITRRESTQTNKRFPTNSPTHQNSKETNNDTERV